MYDGVIFYASTAKNGGAIYFNGSGSLKLSNIYFLRCKTISEGSGGPIYIENRKF
jgi:predicted outer membrane repeat protein